MNGIIMNRSAMREEKKVILVFPNAKYRILKDSSRSQESIEISNLWLRVGRFLDIQDPVHSVPTLCMRVLHQRSC